MTEDAQSALRRTMEQHSKVTRFFFICNYVSRMIDPLVSRCAKFRFTPLPERDVESRLGHICSAEGVQVEDGAFDAVLKASRGDMRRAITIVQSASGLNNKRVTANAIHEVAGYVPDGRISNLVSVMAKGTFDDMQSAVRDIEAEGYSALQVLLQLNHVFTISSNDGISLQLTGLQRATMCKCIAEADSALTDGASEELQLLALGSKAMKILRGDTKTFGSGYA